MISRFPEPSLNASTLLAALPHNPPTPRLFSSHFLTCLAVACASAPERSPYPSEFKYRQSPAVWLVRALRTWIGSPCIHPTFAHAARPLRMCTAHG